MTKLLMLKGLPASGKTTFGRELCQELDWKRVNKDDLRAMLDDLSKQDKQYTKKQRANEPFILKVRDAVIRMALANGYNVVVDDTNFGKIHEPHLKKMASEFDAEFSIKFFDVELQECIKRDYARPNPVGEKVIRKMYQDFVRPKYSPPPFTEGLPRAIIVDIDGTLSHSDQRSPYDPSLYHLDTFDHTVADLVDRYRNDHIVIVCSGREESHRPETAAWLDDNNFKYDYFYMRPTKDRREDSIVKEEIYRNNILNKFNVSLVVDDRDRVVVMWRRMGLKVAQVNEGDF